MCGKDWSRRPTEVHFPSDRGRRQPAAVDGKSAAGSLHGIPSAENPYTSPDRIVLPDIVAMRTLMIFCVLGTSPSLLVAQPTGQKSPTEFTTLIAHWANYADDSYLEFVRDAKPEVCQLGFYGGHFYSLAHTPQYKGYPAHFPARGLPECGQS